MTLLCRTPPGDHVCLEKKSKASKRQIADGDGPHSMNRPISRIVGDGRSPEGVEIVRKLNQGSISSCGDFMASSASC